MRKIIFYGDSNTYGYDPADMETQRYPLEDCWTSIVSKNLKGKAEVVNEGLNGRMLPDPAYEQSFLLRRIALAGEDGIFATMLGTNDILHTLHPDASQPVRKMERYLEFLEQHLRREQILIIAPVPIGQENSPDPLFARYYAESVKMNDAFAALTRERDIMFADAGRWQVGLAFDQIHLSQEGHKTFAAEMTKLLSVRWQI